MIGQRRFCDIVFNGSRQRVSFLDCAGEKEKTPLLFLHGWGGSAESWQVLQKELQQHAVPLPRLLAVDLPGFGFSPAPQSVWSLDNFVAALIGVLDNLHIRKATIVCHSFGGRVALVLAHHFPDRVERIVALAPAGIGHHLLLKRCIAVMAHGGAQLLQGPLVRHAFPVARTVLHRLLGNPEYTNATNAVMQRIYQHAIRRDLSPLLPSLQQPILLCWGRHDTYVPVRDALLLSKLLPHVETHIFEDGRHGIHVTHAREVTSLMIPFLHE